MVNKKNKGFAMIEVMVAISVLVLISAVMALHLSKARQQAKLEKCLIDKELIIKAIEIKRIEKKAVLGEITGSFCSDCGSCRSGNSWTKESVNSADCVSKMTAVFKKLGYPYLPRDSWGDPFLIDENEGEGSYPCESKDVLRSINCGPSFVPFYSCN
jgi:prepilin-type N-terminal cleavage/methylation domain-containing protein